MIQNLCPLDLLIGQAGTEQTLKLAAKTEAGYHWHTPPGFIATAARALHLACAPTQQSQFASPEAPLPAHDRHSGLRSDSNPDGSPMSPQSPLQHPSEEDPQAILTANDSALLHGVNLSKLSVLKGRSTTAPAGHAKEVAWGSPFNCTARGSHQQQLQLADGTHCWVAVSVQKQGPQWLICLQPEYAVCNELASTVHLHYTGQLGGVADASDGIMITIAPDAKVCRRIIPLRNASSSQLMVTQLAPQFCQCHLGCCA